MGASWIKILLFVAGGVAAATGVGYYTGLFGGSGAERPALVAGLSGNDEADSRQPPASAAQQAPAAGDAAQPEIRVPVFDLVRVEPDGSIVIAGQAAPQATLEIVSGGRKLGDATATASGDFATVLDDRLSPGDHQIVLRATNPEGTVATSLQTAVVSVPETPAGQVLALVDEPGAPSRLLTLPASEEEPSAQAAVEPPPPAPPPARETTGAEAPAGEPPVPQGEAGIVARAPVADEPQARLGEPRSLPRIAVEAVEIEGPMVFVAGLADARGVVRVYADDLLLGEARADESGRFLVEASHDLPVGDYIVRADLLAADGSVLARAAVPFTRAPGEAIAAVAPSAPDAQGSDPIPADEADAAISPALEQVDGSVIIRRGDTLWQISRRVYGRGVRYTTIYLANQDQISNPDRIWPGQVFQLPARTQEGEAADLGAVGAQDGSRR